MNHVITFNVEAPENVSHKDVRRVFCKLINAGLSDAQSSLEEEDYDEDAELSINLVIHE
jgi:hypothetical protein